MIRFSRTCTGGRATALVALMCLMAPASVFGQTQILNLAWDPNPEPDITSYYVHVGTASGSYNLATQQVPSNQTTYAFPATPGVRYYFAVSAVNSAGAWSPRSAEVLGGIPTFTQPANQTGIVGTAITALQLSASDPDGGTLQYSATNLPAGLTITSAGRITGIPITLGTRAVTVSVFDGTVTVSRTFTWTINPAPATVTSVSASPASGSGLSQTFAFQYSDSLGGLDLASTWVWFHTSMASSAANSCMLQYNQPANLVYLLNDAGTSWSAATLGTTTTLQNGQCAVSLGSSSRAAVGTVMTLNLAMTFTSRFSGTKNVYLYGASGGGSNSGWHDRGDWTVPAIAVSVAADSATPNIGSGAAQTFALTYSDTLGATDLDTAWVWFHPTFASSGARSCMAYLRRSTNALYLLNDAGTTWHSAPIGSATTLQNSQCAIALGSATAASSGSVLTLSLPVVFKPAFAGAKNIYMFATNAAGSNSGWQDRGDWTSSATAAAVTVDSATPNAGSGSAQTFALRYSDSAGATDLRQGWVWFTGAFGQTNAALNSCLVFYEAPSNTLFLLNDSGTVWQPAVLGTATTLRNSQCTISLGASTASLNGNTMTLSLPITFDAGYGAADIYMYGSSLSGANSGWQDRGDWTAP